MGFTTGFIGGITLTYALTYFTLHLHRQNRIYQSTLLTQQRNLLTSLYTPPEEGTEDSPAYEVRQAGLSEQLKDRWNREIATGLYNLQHHDWETERIKLENRLGVLWGRAKNSETGQAVQENVEAGKEKVVKGAVEVREKAENAVEKAREEARRKAKEAGEVADRKLREAGRGIERGVRKAAEKVDEVVGDGKREAREKLGQKRILEL